ncbi:TPA: type II 3-dehydroquinate dehydratase [Candidatus Galligastranaerophilus faecipullorum]|nr:type II 3-dehydroquinate dehydratase [Candidatus Galligastranaerophilus faecipullorum]
MKILVINGPNLNMLGIREPEIYGSFTLEDIEKELISYAAELDSNISLEFFRSNFEGEIIDKIQSALNCFDGIIINPAAYTHTSVAISDAVAAVGIKTVEVHLSNIYSREEFRHNSYIAPKCLGQVAGFSKTGYKMALLGLYEALK